MALLEPDYMSVSDVIRQIALSLSLRVPLLLPKILVTVFR
jgi:hypothetical protein